MHILYTLLLFCLFLTPLQAAQLELNGNFVQGGIVIGRTLPDSKVTFAGRDIRVSSEGVFIIGFHRDDTGLMPLKIRFGDGSIKNRNLKITARKFAIQRIDGLPPAQVTPDSSTILARIAKDRQLVKSARQTNSDVTFFLDGFIWPAKGRISGVYGTRRILNGIPKWPHYGVDVAAPKGTKVIAPAGGVIILAHPDMYYSGGTILMDHGHGLMSAFLHLESLEVKVGQTIAQGEKIGTIGATGRATGPHLDWRVNWFDKRIDPQLLVKGLPAPLQETPADD